MNTFFFLLLELPSHLNLFLEMLRRNDISSFFLCLFESVFFPEEAQGRNRQKREREKRRHFVCRIKQLVIRVAV